MDRHKNGTSRSGLWSVWKKDGSYQTVISRSSLIPHLDNKVHFTISRPVEEVQSDVFSKLHEGGVHHEINTALTVIIGYLDFVREHEDGHMGSDLKMMFENIDHGITRIEAVLQTIREADPKPE